MPKLALQPVAIAACVRAALYLMLVFGLDLSREQIGAVMIFVESVTGLFVWKNVVPLAKFKTNKANVLHAKPAAKKAKNGDT